MNAENLIPNSERTPSEHRENCRKGGIKSGEARRQRKAVKAAIMEIIYDESPSGRTVLEDMIGGMVRRVVEKGDEDTFERLMEYADLSPERKRKDRELKLKEKQTAAVFEETETPFLRAMAEVFGGSEPEAGGVFADEAEAD